MNEEQLQELYPESYGVENQEDCLIVIERA